MGYFLVRPQSWRCPVSYHLQNMVDDNAAGYQRSKGEKKPAQRGPRWYRSVYELMIMRALASFADDDGGSCFPSVATLADECQCSERTVKRVLKKFRERRWITVKATGRSNHYQIQPHGWVVPAAVPSRACARARLEATKACQTGQPVPSQGPQRPFREASATYDSYQRLSSVNSNQSIPEEGERIDRIFLEGTGKEEAVARGQALFSSSVTSSDSVAQTPTAHKEALLNRGCLDADVWRSILDGVKARRPLITSWIECATPVQCEGTSLTLGFGPSMKSALESLARPNNHRFIEELLGSLFGGTWKLTFELRDDLPEPPALIEQRTQLAAAREGEQNRRIRELQGISVDDNNAHSIWERLLHQPEPVLEQIGKEHNDPRAAGMARKILQRRKAANASRMAHP
jgi:helix-turn-helix protein